MNKKQTSSFALLAMVFGVAIFPLIATNNVEARPDDIRYATQGDLASPNGHNQPGGSRIGTYSLSVKDEIVTIYAGLDKRPNDGMVYEGWLIDVESGTNQSLGKFQDGIKRGFFYAQPNFSYDRFVITEEPLGDLNPSINKVVAVAPLNEPFGK